MMRTRLMNYLDFVGSQRAYYPSDGLNARFIHGATMPTTRPLLCLPLAVLVALFYALTLVKFGGGTPPPAG